MNVVFRAVDSRGIAREQVVALTVADYTPPVMVTLSGMRCDEDGAASSMGVRCWYTVEWEHSALGGANPCAAALSIKARESDQWNAATSDAASGQSGVLTGASGQMEISQGSVYDLRLTLTDAYGAVNFTATVPSAKFVRTVNRALNAVAYGKAAEHPDSFEIDAGLEVWCYGKELGAWMEEKATPAQVKSAVATARAANLLDNSDFTRPVNQRGQSSYSGAVYGIDRWRMWASTATMTLGNQYLDFTVAIYQYFNTLDKNSTYTLAIGKADGSIVVTTGVPAHGTTANGLAIAYDSDRSESYVVIYDIHQHVVWAALYMGEYTLDTLPPYVPKDYAAELMECKRYCRVIDWSSERHAGLFGAATSGATMVYAVLPIDVPMRVTPSISSTEGNNFRIYGGDGSFNPTSVSVWYASINDIGLAFPCNAVAGRVYVIYPATATPIVLSADL